MPSFTEQKQELFERIRNSPKRDIATHVYKSNVKFARLSGHRKLASDRLQFDVSDAYFWLDSTILPSEMHRKILEYLD